MTTKAKCLKEDFSEVLASMARLCSRARREDALLASRIEQAIGVLVMRWPRGPAAAGGRADDTLAGLGPSKVVLERCFPEAEDTGSHGGRD
ncbi:MAG: hypothetical protein ABTD50_18995 [Polyangiaceae bacterium]|jgi:hypothetical protein